MSSIPFDLLSKKIDVAENDTRYVLLIFSMISLEKLQVCRRFVVEIGMLALKLKNLPCYDNRI